VDFRFNQLRAAWPFHIDHDLRIGNVGDRVQGRAENGVDTQDGAKQNQQENRDSEPDNATDDSREHQVIIPRLSRGTGVQLAKTLGEREVRMPRSDRRCADGVVLVRKSYLSSDQHHPVRSIKGGCAIFFLMSRPPLLS
jgi:hypothetical protein